MHTRNKILSDTSPRFTPERGEPNFTQLHQWRQHVVKDLDDPAYDDLLKSCEQAVPDGATQVVFGHPEHEPIPYKYFAIQQGVGASLNSVVKIKDHNKNKLFVKINSDQGDESTAQHVREAISHQIANHLGYQHLVAPVSVHLINANQMITVASEIKGWNAHSHVRPSEADINDIIKAYIFDLILGNGDRHGGNCCNINGRLKLIDHGLTFRNKLNSTVHPEYLCTKTRMMNKHDLAEELNKIDINALIPHVQHLEPNHISAMVSRILLLKKYVKHEMPNTVPFSILPFSRIVEEALMVHSKSPRSNLKVAHPIHAY